LHSDVDKYILKVGTTGGKTLYLIEQRKTMNTHFDGLEYIYEIEDHEEFHRISNLIGDFDFAESYEAIRKDGESIRSKIIKKYEGIGDD
jgi:hypothetical protein